MMSDIIITAKYPYRHCSSGMYTKFIPYQPVINVSGRKIVVSAYAGLLLDDAFYGIAVS